MLDSIEGRLHAALDGTLGGYLRTDPPSRVLWSTDASIYQREPAGVMVARSEEDVKRAVGVARELSLPITPRGTGTSLAGQATSLGLALDTSEMKGIIEIDLGAGAAWSSRVWCRANSTPSWSLMAWSSGRIPLPLT